MDQLSGRVPTISSATFNCCQSTYHQQLLTRWLLGPMATRNPSLYSCSVSATARMMSTAWVRCLLQNHIVCLTPLCCHWNHVLCWWSHFCRCSGWVLPHRSHCCCHLLLISKTLPLCIVVSSCKPLLLLLVVHQWIPILQCSPNFGLHPSLALLPYAAILGHPKLWLLRSPIHRLCRSHHCFELHTKEETLNLKP